MDALQAVLSFVFGLFPTIAVPSWLTNASSDFNAAVSEFGKMQAWLPIPLAVTVTTALLACVVVGFGIKLVRIVASFVTVGGGSAG